MKKITSILILFLAISSCSKLDRFTQFDLEYSEEIVVPSTFGISLPFNIYTPNIQTNSESTLSIEDTRKDLVESISLKSLKLTVKLPEDEDFSFLKSIKIYISAENQEELLVAWKEDIPNSQGNELILEVAEDDLKAYIFETSFQLRLNTVTDEILTKDYTLVADAVFFVDAEVLGV